MNVMIVLKGICLTKFVNPNLAIINDGRLRPDVTILPDFRRIYRINLQGSSFTCAFYGLILYDSLQ